MISTMGLLSNGYEEKLIEERREVLLRSYTRIWNEKVECSASRICREFEFFFKSKKYKITRKEDRVYADITGIRVLLDISDDFEYIWDFDNIPIKYSTLKINNHGINRTFKIKHTQIEKIRDDVSDFYNFQNDRIFYQIKEYKDPSDDHRLNGYVVEFNWDDRKYYNFTDMIMNIK